MQHVRWVLPGSSQGLGGISGALRDRVRCEGVRYLCDAFLVWYPGRLYDDNLALYGKRYYYYIWELPVFVTMGCVAGLLGAAFIKLNIRATQLRARFIPLRKPLLRLLEVSSWRGVIICVVLHELTAA